MQTQGVQQKTSFRQALINATAAFGKWKRDSRELILNRNANAMYWHEEGRKWAVEQRLGFEQGTIDGQRYRERWHDASLRGLSFSSAEPLYGEASLLLFGFSAMRGAARAEAKLAAQNQLNAWFNDSESDQELIWLEKDRARPHFVKGALLQFERNYSEGFEKGSNGPA